MFVDINGNLNLKKIKASKIFQKSILNALQSFPKFETSATLNGLKTSWNYKTQFNFDKNNVPSLKEDKFNYDSIFKRNSTNDFALFLKTKITDEDLKKSNLTRINTKLLLRFELDKKNIPFNICTNARSSYLNDLIVTSFKEYSVENLNFSNKNPINSYITQILAFKNNKTFIKTNSIIGYMRVPVFPGCEKSVSQKDAKKCFSKGVQIHFMKKFDTDLPNRLGLAAGRKKVFISFTINKNGNVININAKTPHESIKKEVISVMKTLPKVQPAIQEYKKVNLKYSIPFTLKVD